MNQEFSADSRELLILKMNDSLFFKSEDGRFCLKISKNIFDGLLSTCVASGIYETGGILVGYYTSEKDVAIATGYSTPPKDSKSGLYWYYRGISGLQRWLRKLWKKKEYYLGEWHFHPMSSAYYSSVDARQMFSIASNPSYNCPEPILVIIGGNPSDKWEAKAFVFPQDSKAKEMVLLKQ